MKGFGATDIINYKNGDVVEQILALNGGQVDRVTIRGGFCPGGAYRIEKLLNLIANKRIDPSKLLNYKFEGFEKIEDAFKVMDEKPRDLIKPIVYINW